MQLSQVHFEKVSIVGRIGVVAEAPHALIIGKSGVGKSNASENIVHDRLCYGRQKIIEVGDDHRWECFGYLFQEKKPNLVGLTLDFDKKKVPESLPTEIIAFSGNELKNKKTIPKCIDVRSIDINSIKLSDLEATADNEATGNALGHICYNYGDMNVDELVIFLNEQINSISDKQLPKQTLSKILRRIYSFKSSGIFNEEFEPIDFKKIIFDKKRITVFNTNFIESNIDKGLALSLTIQNLVREQKIWRVPITLYCREASRIVKSDLPTSYTIAKEMLNYLARQGRDMQFSLLLDTQRLQDIPVDIRRNVGTIHCFKMDVADIAALSNDVAIIDFKLTRAISQLQKGWYLVLHSAGYDYPLFSPPTRHYHKQPRDIPFEILGQHFGYKKVVFKQNNSQNLIKEDDVGWITQMNKIRKKK